MGRSLAAALCLACTLRASSLSVDFPFDRIPRHLWPRELVWLKNIGVSTLAVSALPPSAADLMSRLRLKSNAKSNATRLSVLDPQALIRSRHAMARNESLVWTDVETESAPQYHRGGVAIDGEEDPALLALRREADVRNYWAPLLTAAQTVTVSNKLPDSMEVEQRAIPEASALNIINAGLKSWQGDLQAALPSYKHTIRIPDVTVPANDALLLPIDVAFRDPRFCRFCSGMSNSERLLYATAELTAIEYENGILSFEFYAPVPAFAVLQLEREPEGPMLAAGHPIAFDWDAENKRAKLPIPASKSTNKRVRIAITVSAPDNVASFSNTRTLVIGETNHILTDYSSEVFAKRSRLVTPVGWKCVGETKSPTQVEYRVDVPKDRLHGEREDLRLEADGIGMSHVRVQLLRPVSVHVAEAAPLHFGDVAELVSDPPLVPVESPTGRTVTVQIRNNAPEIRTFRVAVSGDQLDFTPSNPEVVIGAMMEREVSFRVFTKGAHAGLHDALIKITGATAYEQPLRFVVLPRGDTVNYQADLTGTGTQQSVWENSSIRAVFSSKDGGRWLEFYWKASGKNLLSTEGVTLSAPVAIDLSGDELSIDGPAKLPVGGKNGTVTWTVERTGSMTRYRVTDSAATRDRSSFR